MLKRLRGSFKRLYSKMEPRVSVHAMLAMLYLIINLPVLGILLLSNTFAYTIRYDYSFFVLVVSATINIAPTLTRFQTIKQHFCWTDALDLRNNASPQLMKIHSISPCIHYEKRVHPYLRNIGLLCASMFLIGQLTVSNISVALVFGAMGMYLFFITVVIVLTIVRNRIRLTNRFR